MRCAQRHGSDHYVGSNFGPKRARYDELMARPDDLLDILKAGADKARAVARPVIERVRDATGLPARAW